MIFKDFQNLNELLFHQANIYKNKKAYIYLADGETTEQCITYSDLLIYSNSIASLLLEHCKDRDRVLIFLPPSLEYIISFYGCLIAGLIPVPLYPPETRSHSRLINVIKDSGAKVAITDKITKNRYINKENINKNDEAENLIRSIKLIDIDINELLSAPIVFKSIKSDDIAFLQYTSGSTSQPKGVMVTHKNLLVNSSLIKKYFNHNDNECQVSWLPPYHDMGLIGDIIQTLFSGMTMVFMSPMSFLKKPIRWLKAITKYSYIGEITSGAPNFAYDWCCKLYDESFLEELDLSKWKVAYNGSEPVKYSTITNFIDKFSKCGFKAEAMCPVYGLAENTLMVSPPDFKNKPFVIWVDRRKFNNGIIEVKNQENNNESLMPCIGCGPLVNEEEIEIKIVNTSNYSICKDGEIGEIWLAGESVTKGYWNKEVETEKTFKAHLSKDENKNYLRTGDSGFIYNGQIFIAGRIKEIIIIHGENYYPQDIEEYVEKSSDQIRQGCGAAIGVKINDEEEKLVIVYELKKRQYSELELKNIKEAINKTLFQIFGFTPYDIVFIQPSTFPKTSSGKLQRNYCKELYLNKKLQTITITEEIKI